MPDTTTTRPPAGAGLSVCCVTDASPEQTGAALASLARVADEVVVAVDERCSARLEEYEVFADRVIVVPSGIVEQNLAVVHAACSHEWVFRIDSDEAASPALVARLPELLRAEGVRQYAIARRCVVEDGGSWVDEVPWWPDFQVRLIRAASARFPEEVHQPVESDDPLLLVAEPLLHFDCVLRSPVERQEKILR